MKPTEPRKPLNRRRFLKTTAAAGLATLPGAGVLAASPESVGHAQPVRPPRPPGRNHASDDPLGVRASFPVTEELAYLNTASSGPLPVPVRDALHAYADEKMLRRNTRAGREAIASARSAFRRSLRCRRGRTRLSLRHERRREHHRKRDGLARGRQRRRGRTALHHHLRPLPRAGAPGRDRTADHPFAGRGRHRGRLRGAHRPADAPDQRGLGLEPQRLPLRPAASGRPRPRPRRLPLRRRDPGVGHLPHQPARRERRFRLRQRVQVAARRLRVRPLLRAPRASGVDDFGPVMGTGRSPSRFRGTGSV